MLYPGLPPKPLLRGHFHQAAFFVALGAGAMLVAEAAREGLAIALYVTSLAGLFGISALYHRIDWDQARRLFMRRLDHSAIYVLIAGTYTPIAVLALPPDRRGMLLGLTWGVAALGVVKSVLWPGAPKAFSASVYVAMGCLVLPFLPGLAPHFTPGDLGLLLAGGGLHVLGAVTYATRRPDPWPAVFGYHEIFHLLVVAACACHFWVIRHLVLGS